MAAEGLARDLVRAVQQARRAADLDVSDRITLTISGSAAVQDAARHHEALIAGETLATTFTVVDQGLARPGVSTQVRTGTSTASPLAPKEPCAR